MKMALFSKLTIDEKAKPESEIKKVKSETRRVKEVGERSKGLVSVSVFVFVFTFVLVIVFVFSLVR